MSTNGVKMGLKSSSTRYTWVGVERGEIYYCHERGEDGTEELLHEVHLGGGEKGETYYCHERGEDGTEELLY